LLVKARKDELSRREGEESKGKSTLKNLPGQIISKSSGPEAKAETHKGGCEGQTRGAAEGSKKPWHLKRRDNQLRSGKRGFCSWVKPSGAAGV